MAVQLVPDAIDPAALLGGFCRGRKDIGAVVSFTGLVRDDGGKVQALELDAYSGFTDVQIAGMAEETHRRFSLSDVLVVHRTGVVKVGEPVVFVAAAAPHRRAAFEAADQLMDYLKSRAPLWKRSHEAEGPRWIEPTVGDYEDAARWDVPRPAAAERAPS